jgi:crotonobetainyl-CoA:carnitine CoA-transferase CaiB-like acyl-CoA transferase
MSSGSSNFPESNGAPAGDGVRAREFLTAMTDSLRSGEGTASDVSFVGSGNLPSVFPVSDFAAAAVGAAGAAVADLLTSAHGVTPRVEVDRRLASLWFGFSIQPIDWALPAPWDPIAGDYPTADGWIRLHTNAPHHRAAALSVLDVPADKQAVAAAVARWKAEELETAIVGNKGCAAAMRSVSEWTAHPQGQAVIREPLIDARATADSGDRLSFPTPERPLRGIRVLDLTRVLAGPVATRFLAGLGADVLRIDPPTWDEPGVVPDVALGKRCARLDLRTTEGRKTLLELLGRAHVLVHGYRSDALDNLGLDARLRREVRPGLVDVSLDAYGWSGPWRNRRGFDSLVQMSVGIADAGMRTLERNRPTPLPVQALDHATGYLMAAVAVRGLRERLETGRGFEGRTSLARVAELLLSAPVAAIAGDLGAADETDWSDRIETTDFGMARRLRSPITIASMQLQWHRPAGKLGSSLPIW